MAEKEPVAELDPRYSDENAEQPTGWDEARRRLAGAEVFWLSTVRGDGRPHVTPLIAVWLDGALHFSTGPGEQKARNLAANTQVVLTTGNASLGEGLDLVVEGEAVRVRGSAALQAIAAAFEAKYGPDWHFDVQDETFRHEAGSSLVFTVAPRTAYGFRKGKEFSHTRWRF